MRILLLFLIATISIACTTNPVVGKWKPVRTYDPVRKKMVPLSYDALLEISGDGTFKAILPDGSQRTGQYELDEGVIPHRFTATEKDRTTVRGIYSAAADSLGVRLADDDSAVTEFPKTVTDPGDDANPRIIEFERKK